MSLDEKLLINNSYYGCLETVKQLVEKGVNIHARNNEALLDAICQGQFNVIKYLVC